MILLNQLGKDYFIEEYINKKKSSGVIAKELAVTQPAIMYWLKKYNIPRRNNSDSQILVKRNIDNCICKTCGKNFHTKPYSIKRGRGIYCSYDCMFKCRSKNLKENKHHLSGFKFNKENSFKEFNKNYKDGRAELKMYSIMRNAHKRGYGFSLKAEDIREYWKKPCFYCGSPMEAIGLDRVDNSRGYTKDNIVSCCWDCNRIKMTMTIDGFFEKIIKIYTYNKLWERADKQANDK